MKNLSIGKVSNKYDIKINKIYGILSIASSGVISDVRFEIIEEYDSFKKFMKFRFVEENTFKLNGYTFIIFGNSYYAGILDIDDPKILKRILMELKLKPKKSKITKKVEW